MERFRYQARDAAGKGIRGDVIALDPDEAAELLQEAGVYVTALQPEDAGGRRTHRRNPLVFMPTRERLVLLESWVALLHSGFPMQQAITQLRRTVRRPLVKRALLEIQHCVDRGCALAVALRTSRLFPVSWVSLVENGEKRGDYVTPLETLIAYCREMGRIRRELLSMLWMPCALLVLAIACVWVYLVRIVPSVLAVVSQSGGSMPAVRALAAHSSGISNLLLGFLLAVCLCALIVLRSARADRTMGLIQTWVPPWFPVLGPMVSRMHVIVVCSELRMQINAGVPIIEAVRALSQSVPHPVIRRDLIHAYRALRDGMPVPQALEGVGIIPPMGHTLLTVGNSCGQLPEMLELLVRETVLDLMEEVKRMTVVFRNLAVLASGVMVGLLVVGAFVLLQHYFQVLLETSGEPSATSHLETYLLRPLADLLGKDLFLHFTR